MATNKISTGNMRHAARQCVARAKAFLASDEASSVRHACLELRFAIEYITYDQLLAYLEEMPTDVIRKWTPKQLISEMREVDPTADKSATLAIGLEEVDGVPIAQPEMQLLGMDRRFSLKWAHSHYNALGSYLHVPSLFQIETGKIPSTNSMIEKAKEIATECDEILKSPIYGVNFGHFFEFQCGSCKSNIRRRLGSFSQDEGIRCPQCTATYDVEEKEPEKYLFHLRTSKYKCLECKAENEVGTHRVISGEILECKTCNITMVIQQRFEVVLGGANKTPDD